MKRFFRAFVPYAFVPVFLALVVFFAVKNHQERQAMTTNLTELRLNESVIREFIVENPTNNKRTIRDIVPSCTCTTVLRHDPFVPAQGKGRFMVRVQPERLGRLDVFLNLSYLDSTEQSTFEIRSFVLPPSRALDLVPVKMAESALTASKLLITGPEAIAAAATPDNKVLFVDVRSPEKFQLGHIPNAINMPLSSLRGRAFLKNHAMILLDQGIIKESLVTEARHFRTSSGNRDVHILDGGLQAWRNAGGSLTGSHPNASALAEIDSEDAFECARRSNWRIIALDNVAGHYRLGDLFSQLVKASSRDPRAIRNQFEHGVKHLIVSAQGEHYHSLHTKLSRQSEVYYLAGGAEAYLKYLQNFHPPAQDRRWVTLAEHSGKALPASRNRSRSGGCVGCPK